MSRSRTCVLAAFLAALSAVPAAAQGPGKFLDRGRADWLKDLMEGAQPAVRRSAAFALGKVGDERDLRTLLALAQKDGEDGGVRAAALTAHGEILAARGGDPSYWSA